MNHPHWMTIEDRAAAGRSLAADVGNRRWAEYQAREKARKERASRRYAVYSVDRYPDGGPAGEYPSLEQAIEHAETVTYKMAVVDRCFESRGFVYCNWDSGCATCGRAADEDYTIGCPEGFDHEHKESDQ